APLLTRRASNLARAPHRLTFGEEHGPTLPDQPVPTSTDRGTTGRGVGQDRLPCVTEPVQEPSSGLARLHKPTRDSSRSRADPGPRQARATGSRVREVLLPSRPGPVELPDLHSDRLAPRVARDPRDSRGDPSERHDCTNDGNRAPLGRSMS